MSAKDKKETYITYKSDLEIPSKGKYVTSFAKVEEARKVLDQIGA